MGEDPLPILKKWGKSLIGNERSKKRNILIATILVIATGLFFSVLFREKALAKKSDLAVDYAVNIPDPMERVGQGFQEKITSQKSEQQICEISLKAKIGHDAPDPMEDVYVNMLKGHPMTEMVGNLAREDKTVAAFLIGIAKKESDWGTHSPKKGGKDCYNYWGYKGGYNVTEGGYSCFDNPEQAIDVVGQRIADLIAKKIDTPARMVVWKCGSSCSGHDPVAVKKWISDVSLYVNRLES